MKQLSRPLLDLIRLCVPTLDAARVLLYLAANRERTLSAREIAAEMPMTALSPATVTEYAALLARFGLAIEVDGRFLYNSTSSADKVVDELSDWYNARPVNLIVTMSKVSGSKVGP